MTPAPAREAVLGIDRPSGAVAALPRDDFDRRVWSLLGLPVDMATVADAVAMIEAAARDRRRLSFVTPNLNWLVSADRNPELRRQIIDADLSLADGAPLVLLARFLGAPLQARAAGSDLFDALRARSAFAPRIRVFFFGGRPGAAEQAAAALAREEKGLVSAGFLDPGHGDVASMSGDDIIDKINASGADFVVVALGAAKGQAWIDRNQARLDAAVISHLGAVVDFAAGVVRRAPRAVQRLGLEWAWRIREEPLLWRRYAGDALAFAALLFTRLAPALLARRPRATGAPAGAALVRTTEGVTVRLSGDLVEQGPGQGLGPVREAFRDAAAANGRIRLDFSRAGRTDAAFVGLLLMLEKHAARRGVQLETAGLSPAILGTLRRHKVNFTAVSAGETEVGERKRAG